MTAYLTHTIRIGWRDLLRALLRRKLEVAVLVDADVAVMFRLENPDRLIINGSAFTSSGGDASW